MKRISLVAALAVAVSACSGGSSKPGALLHGPGALAFFDGRAAGASIRTYLAVANQRGDELRLLDTTDDQIVASPGLVFPLSVPSSGRPLWLASADLNDGALVGGARITYDRPDALMVVAAGANEVQLVDTWSGAPTVVASVPLPADAPAVISMAAAAVPGAVGKARVLVGLAGGKIAVIDLARAPDGDAIVAPTAPTAVLDLGFDAASIARSPMSDDYVWVATRDPLPGGALGVAKVAIPADPTGWSAATLGNVTPVDAGRPIEAIAPFASDPWTFPAAGTPQADAWGARVERLVAVPVPGECGARCGLIALDAAGQVANPVLDAGGNPIPGDDPFMIPVPIPAPIDGLLAVGRGAANLVPITGGLGGGSTGLAVVTAADGRVYAVDLARWRIASDTSPVAGTGMTRVSAASTVPGTGSAIGLWPLHGAAAADVSAASADLPARVRVTPGFTPDDDWTLTWRGVLPGLETRGALLDGTTLTVQFETDLAVKYHVAVGDRVDVAPIAGYCAGTTEAEVSGVSGAAVTLAPVAPAATLCFSGAPAGTGAVATFRASGLVLVGGRTGYAGRPEALTSAPVPDADPLTPAEFMVGGPRLFHVMDPCDVGSECANEWTGAPHYLSFPFPSGPTFPVAVDAAWTRSPGVALGLSAGFVKAKCVLAPPTVTSCATSEPPSPGAAIRFTTRSGLVPSARRPTVDGGAVDSDLPSGLALHDSGGGEVGAYVSYSAGLVMHFTSGEALGKMNVIR